MISPLFSRFRVKQKIISLQVYKKMSGTPSPKQSSSSSSAASFIKVVQQLIQSDDDQILLKKMLQLQSSFPLLRKITSQLSNQDKLSLFIRDTHFTHKLYEKLLEQFGIEKIPVIKVQLYSTRYRSVIEEELDQNDLLKVFDRFGKISVLCIEKTSAYIRFQSAISSYLAIKTLNQFEVVTDLLRLSVRWCKPEEQAIAEQLFYAKFNSITNAFGNLNLSQKFNSKYQIHLTCPPEFKLAQKIIGPKGNNIKKVFETISQQHKIASIKDVQKNLKLRLRGKGSGYSEGPNGEQSDQILNFCISSKEKPLYDSACEQIERILEKLAKDYKFEFQRSYRRLLQGTVYKKYELHSNNYELKSQLKLQQLPSNLTELNQNQGKKLTPQYIQEQINLRNKARRLGKYQQADEIREKLRKKGILLIDGTGKTNIYSTSWSEIGQ